MEQRRDLYLLYKEAVNNIFKHADAKQVSIKIAIDQHLKNIYTKLHVNCGKEAIAKVLGEHLRF